MHTTSVCVRKQIKMGNTLSIYTRFISVRNMSAVGKRALLVGINKYDHEKITNLNFCVNDVTSTFKILTDPDRGGFTEDNCLLMTDRSRRKNEKPTRSNLMSQVTMLSRMANPDDYILFFFSGHGMYHEETGKSYLLPADASLSVLADTAVSIGWIKKTMGKSKARAKVMILDACHTGAIKGKAESGLMTKGLHDAIFPAPEGFAILSSCKMLEVSYEMSKTKNSVFTHFLNEGLRGGADFDSDGKIAVPDASRYAVDRTLEWAHKNRVEQSPNLDYKCVRDLILVHVPKIEGEVAPEKVEATQDSVAYLPEKLQIGVSFEYKEGWEGKAWAEKLCAFLLEYFDQDLITCKATKYRFPGGSFQSDVEKPGLRLNYGKTQRKAVNEFLLAYSSSKLKMQSVEYWLPKNLILDFTKVAKQKEKLKLSNVKFAPEKKMVMADLGEPFISSGSGLLRIFFCNPSAEQELASIFIRPKAMKPFSGELYKKNKTRCAIRILGRYLQKIVSTCIYTY